MGPKALLFQICLLILLQGSWSYCHMYGLAYTPYRVMGECPTLEEAEEDIAILMKHTSRVRTYTSLCMDVNRVLLRYASEGKLSVLFGVWIDGVDMDQTEMDTLIDSLREYPDAQLAGIAIGNEVAFRGSMSVEQVAELVNNMRYRIRQLGTELGSDTLLHVPVFTIEIIPKPELVACSDVVAVNIHPFYRYDIPYTEDPEEMATRLVDATIQQIDIYRNMAYGKQFVVTEIGWPTDSDASTDSNIGDMEVSHLFMQKFTDFASTAGIEYYFFELFDSLWKKPWFEHADDSLSEFHWGLYYGDRHTPKFPECY